MHDAQTPTSDRWPRFRRLDHTFVHFGWIILMWIVQGAALLVIPPLMAHLKNGTHSLYVVDWYLLRKDLRSTWIAGWSVLMCVLVIGEVAFLWPTRFPVWEDRPGPGVAISFVLAGFAVMAIGMSATLGVVSVLDLSLAQNGSTPTPVSDWLDQLSIPIVALAIWWVILMWIGAVVLMWIRRSHAPRETQLAKVASRVAIAAAGMFVVLLPLDLAQRWDGWWETYALSTIGLEIASLVAVVTSGPAILLRLMTRRRREFYIMQCESCGYDMRGCSDAERCPECGAGWAR